MLIYMVTSKLDKMQTIKMIKKEFLSRRYLSFQFWYKNFLIGKLCNDKKLCKNKAAWVEIDVI